ncbi:hypothetical protein Tco_0714882 [Tanacetum coccineum]
MMLFLKLGWVIRILFLLKKAIAAQPKMYDGDMLHSEKLIINSTDSEETLEDAEESQIKMKDKMIQLSTIEKGKNVNTKFDSSKTLGKRVCVTPFNKQIAHKAMNVTNTKVNANRSKPVTLQSTSKPEQGVESSHSVRRSTSKDIKSKNSILKNTKSSSTYVWKTLNSACLDSNKSDTKTSNVCQTNACISNSKTVKACVNVVKDRSNIVCISCGNDVFLNSQEKRVALHALSRKSSVKRALFTSPLASKSTNLGATFVVTKSRLTVAKILTTTSKVSSALTPSSDSRTTRTLSSYMNNKIATNKKWKKWFEYQHGFNWTPRSKSDHHRSRCNKSDPACAGLPRWQLEGDKVCRGVGRHRGEERGRMSCLVVRTGHKKMMNSVPRDISAWHDKWYQLGPLDMLISKRDLYDARLADDAKVAELIAMIDGFGLMNGYSSTVWDMIKVKGKLENVDVSMYRVVDKIAEKPFRNNIWRILQRLIVSAVIYYIWQERRPIIPGHEVEKKEVAWKGGALEVERFLISKFRIKMDLISSLLFALQNFSFYLSVKTEFRIWQLLTEFLPSFLNYSSTVWDMIKVKGKLENADVSMYRVVDKIAEKPFRNNIWRILQRLIVSAVIYYIWQERN